jgi:hypothetical protein
MYLKEAHQLKRQGRIFGHNFFECSLLLKINFCPKVTLNKTVLFVSFATLSMSLKNLVSNLYTNITGVFFKFGVEVGFELSIVNALYRLRITDQLLKSYAFIRVVRSQSILQRLLRWQI